MTTASSSGETTIDPHRDQFGSGLTSVSCPLQSFCVATDASGYIYTYAHGTWSDGALVGAAGTSLNSVSCPTSSFCVAVAGYYGVAPPGESSPPGYSYVLSGGAWKFEQATANAGYGYSSVSCPTTSFCVAVPGPGSATYSDGTWSAGSAPSIPAPSSLRLGSVSCPNPSVCVALGGDRGEGIYAATLTDGSWSTPQGLDSQSGPEIGSVSCATSDVCVAVGGGGTSMYNGSAWSSRPLPAGGDPASAVSCPTPSFCMAVGGGSAYTDTSGTWSSPHHVGTGLAAVSCPTPSFCMAVGNGSAYRYSDGTWN